MKVELNRLTFFLEGDYDPEESYPKVDVTLDTRSRPCPLCRKPKIYRKRALRGVFHGGSLPAPGQGSLGLGEPVFSGKMVGDLTAAGITGFVPHPLPIYRTLGPGVTVKVPGTDFHWIEIVGRVDADLEVFNRGEDSVCPECGRWSPRRKLGHTVSWGPGEALPGVGDLGRQRFL